VLLLFVPLSKESVASLRSEAGRFYHFFLLGLKGRHFAPFDGRVELGFELLFPLSANGFIIGCFVFTFDVMVLVCQPELVFILLQLL